MSTTGVARIEQEIEWVVAHEALSRLARQRAAADAEEGRWLLAALRSAAHVHLGFGSFGEYAERLLGHKPRSTQERLRVAEALEQLPAMTRALEEGTLHWSAVRELTRVAVAENERQWIEVARGKSVRQLEELVAGKRPGDDPSSPHQPDARRHVLRFEVAPETFALFREALTALRRSTEAALDDDAALLAMARHVLGGPREESRASYQVVLSVCSECGRGQQSASGAFVPVGAEIVAMAQCDSQQIDPLASRRTQEGSPLGGALANDNAHASARTEGRPRSAPVRSDVEADGHPAAPAEHRAHVGASASSPRRTRARQTPPPALRRAVLLRDHRCCRVPGCRNARFLDLHHVQLRSEGGQNHPENLLTLCSVHHRAAHRGELLIDGSPASGLRFSHADGSAYGESTEPRSLEAQAKTFGALRTLGFREAEIRAVLAKLREESDLRDATTERWLRAALACLTRPLARS